MERREGGTRVRPGLEIVYPVAMDAEDGNEALDLFLTAFEWMCKDRHDVDASSSFTIPGVDPERVIEEPLQTWRGDTPMRKPLKIKDPEEMGLQVVERRLPIGYSHQHRLYWSKNDIGQIKGEIRNIHDREFHPYTPGNLQVTFSEVIRASDIDGCEDDRALALLPDAATDEVAMITRFREGALRAFSKRLERYRFPDAKYVPAMDFVRVRGENPEPVIKAAIHIARELLPITVELGMIEFNSGQSIRP